MVRGAWPGQGQFFQQPGEAPFVIQLLEELRLTHGKALHPRRKRWCRPQEKPRAPSIARDDCANLATFTEIADESLKRGVRSNQHLLVYRFDAQNVSIGSPRVPQVRRHHPAGASRQCLQGQRLWRGDPDRQYRRRKLRARERLTLARGLQLPHHLRRGLWRRDTTRRLRRHQLRLKRLSQELAADRVIGWTAARQ